MPKNSKPAYFDLLKGKMILLLLAFSIILGSCQTGQNEKSATAKAKVLVSILPYKYFVKQIAGDALDVMVLIPPGTAPHVYDPSPRQMAALNDVDVYFYNGHLSFEQSLIGKIEDNFPAMDLLNLSANMELLSGELCTDHSHNHDHASDPHTWLSAVNGKIIAKNLYDFLVEKYPDEREIFATNYSKLIAKIDNLHQDIQNTLRNAPSAKFMIFHPSLSYFARDYDLEQIPIEFEGKEPSPAKLKASLDLARLENIRSILIQKEFDENNARIIAEAIGGQIIVIDPLAENWDNNLLDIATKIAQSAQ